MSHPAIAYAESTLGVHQVWEDANEINDQIVQTTTKLIEALAKRRSLDDRIESREMDLLIEERGKHPDHSEAAFQRHLKEVHHRDSELQSLRSERAAVASVVQAAELTAESLRAQVKLLSARMEELGGYLAYLAAVKNAEVFEPLSP